MGTGDSRYLKSIAGFLQVYPNYEAFAAALVAGTLPIDLNGKNPDGWAQQGTVLNKANLLTDATAALEGLGSEATPNEMFAALANRFSRMIPTAPLTLPQASVPWKPGRFIWCMSKGAG